MRHALAWSALVLPMLIAGGSAVAQNKTEKDPDKEKTSDKWIKVGTITGKVTAVYEDKRKLRVQIPKLDPNQVVAYGNAQRDLANNRAQGNYQGMVNAQNAMNQAMARLYGAREDIEVQAIEDVVVRSAQPKQDFDDKGRVKKLTAAERKEQKGSDPKLPGYNGEFGDIQAEYTVALTVVRKKGAARPKPKARPPVMKKNKGDMDLDLDALDDTSPQVSQIIFSPPPMQPMPRGKGK